MKFPAKKIIVAIIFGGVLLDAGFSFAQNTAFIFDNHKKIYLHDKESSERKKEFWEKFRESVTPREKNPDEADKPKEVHPREIHPHEIK